MIIIPLNRVFLIYVPGSISSVLIFAQPTAEIADVLRSVSKTIDSPSFREKSRLSGSVARTVRSEQIQRFRHRYECKSRHSPRPIASSSTNEK